MAQHDYNIANQSGASFRQDLNNALSAVVTLNSGATSPSTTFAYQLWADTTAGVLKIRNAANNAWITLAELDGTLTMETGSAGSPGLYFRGDTNTGFFSAAADELAIATGGIQRLMIDSSGRVLLGPGAAGRAVGGAVVAQLGIETLGQAMSLVRNSADTSGAIIALGKSRATTAGGITAVQDLDILGELRFCGANGTDLTSVGAHIRAIVTGVVGSGGDLTDMPTSLAFSVTPDGEATAAEAMRIDPSKRLLVGTSSSSVNTSLVLNGSSSGAGNPGIVYLQRNEATPASDSALGQIHFSNNAGNAAALISSVRDGGTWTSGSSHPGRLVFSITADGASSPTERMRITNGGAVRINTTIDQLETGEIFSVVGCSSFSRTGATVHRVNRTNDGQLVAYYNNGVEQGGISVSGSTVSYNGAHLTRWSQLPGIDPHDKDQRPEILRGTVMSNLDEMCDWINPESGEAQDNEQLNKTKVSDVEGDKNVAGVFQSWDDDDDTWVNDYYLAMTGDFIIRIAEGVTIERGDLLMSAGDGTAKPQDDDIIRSKTIAKVTSTNVSCTYEDGSYCVPCVLMAC